MSDKTAEDLLQIEPGRILVVKHRVSPKERGFFLPQDKHEDLEDRQTWGTVIAAGPPIETDLGIEIPTRAKRGDCVLMGEFAGHRVRIPIVGQAVIIRFDEILAVAPAGGEIAEKLEAEQVKIREEIREYLKSVETGAKIETPEFYIPDNATQTIVRP